MVWVFYVLYSTSHTDAPRTSGSIPQPQYVPRPKYKFDKVVAILALTISEDLYLVSSRQPP